MIFLWSIMCFCAVNNNCDNVYTHDDDGDDDDDKGNDDDDDDDDDYDYDDVKIKKLCGLLMLYYPEKLW